MEYLGLDALLQQALEEDIGQADITTEAIEGAVGVSHTQASGEVTAKEACVLAGWPVFVRVFQLLGSVRGEAEFEEGASIASGQKVGRVEGPISVLLRAERTALNLLQRLSGIATETRRYVKKVSATGTLIVDTRKTTPLWRFLEKRAVLLGGGGNHRMGLYDGFLIKENHIVAAGSIEAAVKACRGRTNHLQKIEVEVTTLDELDQALAAGADAVLLDNMDPATVRKAVQRANHRCVLEVSGGVTANNIADYARCGVDLISVGALTHSAPAIDFSLVVKIHEHKQG